MFLKIFAKESELMKEMGKRERQTKRENNIKRKEEREREDNGHRLPPPPLFVYPPDRR